ncbi:phage tail tape measure protein [Acidovorax sp. A1169]|uniref:phage tail tape measure protein n=1 Tax=Acidovorax sp. A1169 TaxID=3059524 RepID=UPI002737D02F|nr:phage tail tape measure protein [Acidovorax sp. A1169]MDP4074201.1 phage tail tape measure protein [Acidovorax sp. A1169]
MAFKPIEILINAKDNASGVFGKVQAAAGALGAALLAYFGINAFAGVVKGAADFEQSLSRVQAATGATAEEMAQLKKAAEDVGAAGKFSSVEAAGAIENLAKAGLSAKEAIQALPAVLSLAAAGDIELATSAEYVTKAVRGLGLAFTDAGRVADVLALGANATNTSVKGLAEALSYAAPVANSLGMSLESTVAIIGKFADAGIDASRAGTALNSILSQFSDPASKFRGELAAVGISTNDFDKALRQLAASGPRGAQAISAVGQEAGPALRALLNQGVGALDELVGKLQNAEGSAAATAAVMQNNLNSSVGALGKAWEYLTNTLGAPVLPVIKDAVDQLAASLRGAVADGTVGRFGEAIATAFSTGVKFVREFVSTIDFGVVIQRISTLADDANAAFTRLSEYATNAGNAVKLAWGVMATGANALLAVTYKTAEFVVGHIASIQAAFAVWNDILAKFSFGGISKRFKEVADEVRLSSAATGAAADALGQKASAAFEAAARGAKLAQEGWAGFTKAVEDAPPAVREAAKASEEMSKSMDLARETTETAQRAIDAKAASDIAAAGAIGKLRAEYQAAVDTGNWQAAAEVQERLNAALRGTGGGAKEAALAVDAAFRTLGLKTTEALNKTAADNQQAWDTITAAGVKSADTLREAFAAYANAAMEAAQRQGDAAVRTTRALLESKAAAAGLKLEVTDTGNVIVKSMRDAAGATKGAGDAARQAAGGYQQMGQSAEAAAAAAKKLQAIYDRNKVGDGSDLVGKSGDVREAAVLETDITADIVKRYGEDMADSDNARKAWALRQQLQNYQKSYGNVTRSQESLNQQRNIAAELARVEGLIEAERNGGKANGGTTAASKPTTNTPTAPTTSSGGSSRTPGGSGISGPTSTVVFDLKSGPQSIEGMTPRDVTVINSVIQELARGKGTAR